MHYAEVKTSISGIPGWGSVGIAQMSVYDAILDGAGYTHNAHRGGGVNNWQIGGLINRWKYTKLNKAYPVDFFFIYMPPAVLKGFTVSDKKAGGQNHS